MIIRSEKNNKIQNLILQKSTTLVDVIKNLDQTGHEISLIVDEKNSLIGVITNGDIRKAVLNRKSLETPIDKIMNRNFVAVNTKNTREENLELLEKKGINHLVVVSDENEPLDIVSPKKDIKTHLVVIMAGGKGTRLHPLTKTTPKPMIKVAGKPILERIIVKLREQGFSNFLISVNFGKKFIMEYFDDGSMFDVNIEYLIEEKPLGTGGSLSLINHKIYEPILVLNADLITTVNFANLIDFSKSKNNLSVVCVKDYKVNIPFGVIETTDDMLVNIVEKPEAIYSVNAGIYVINPNLLKLVAKNTFQNITDIILMGIASGENFITYKIEDYWLDVGEPKTLIEAEAYFENNLK